LWRVLTDRPLPESHPDYNSFQEFLRLGDWEKHKVEVINYWMNFKTKPGGKKAIFLQKEGLLTDKERKMLKIKKL
jgi:hypothetical protein